jgi:hypothetical protein
MDFQSMPDEMKRATMRSIGSVIRFHKIVNSVGETTDHAFTWNAPHKYGTGPRDYLVKVYKADDSRDTMALLNTTPVFSKRMQDTARIKMSTMGLTGSKRFLLVVFGRDPRRTVTLKQSDSVIPDYPIGIAEIECQCIHLCNACVGCNCPEPDPGPDFDW